MENSLGLRIKLFRQKAELTQEKLAQAAIVPYTTLTKIESGAIKGPSVQVVLKIANALGTTVDDLMKEPR